MKIKSICYFFIFAVFVLFTVAALMSRTSYTALSTNVLRLHIRADGNDTYSQNQKLLVRDKLLEEMNEVFAACTSKEEAIACAIENTDKMQKTAQEVLHSQGCDLPVTVEIGDAFFPYKKYNSDIYPPGIYQAVNVIIGSGEGHNWWCVMYPTLCFTDICTDKEQAVITDSPLKPSQIRFRFLPFLNRLFNRQ